MPECLKGGLDQSEEEQSARGLNSSANHVDFMLGAPDLSITGITKDGQDLPIFRDRNWAFSERQNPGARPTIVPNRHQRRGQATYPQSLS